MVLVDEDEREKAVAAGGRTVCLNVPQEGIAKAAAQIESKMVTIAKFLCRVSWTKRLRSLTSGGGPGSHSGHSSPMVTVAFLFLLSKLKSKFFSSKLRSPNHFFFKTEIKLRLLLRISHYCQN